MTTVVATFVMAPDLEVAWEQVWPQADALCRQQPGFRTARLLRDAHRPRRYMLHTEWESREHVNEFVRTSGLLWLLRSLDLFAEHPTVTYFDVLADAAP
jgi:heme-degrading monooxygenase HmoA